MEAGSSTIGARSSTRPGGLADAQPRAREPGEEETSTVAASLWATLAIFVIFAIAYGFFGYKIVVDQHVVVFDALDRLSRALMVWHNDPPKLAAIGFTLPPLGTLSLVPFGLFRDLVSSGIALPISSAIFAAGGLAFIERMFVAAEMGFLRFGIVLLVAINPMYAFYAVNGMPDSFFFVLVAFALFCYVAWARTLSVRYLIGTGLALAIASLVRYEFIAWTVLLAFVFAALLASRDRESDEVQGTAVAFLAPLFYCLGLWIFFNLIVLGDPFEWIDVSRTEPIFATGPGPDFSIGSALAAAVEVNLIFPVTLVVIPFLIFSAFREGGAASVGIALLIVLNIVWSIGSAAIAGSIDAIELKDALPGMLAGLAGLAYLHYAFEGSRTLVAIVAVIGTGIALPFAWDQMKDYPHQNLEQAFTRAALTNEDQEGTSSRGGFTVGVGQESDAARYIEGLESGRGEILTDNSRTFGVIGLTGEPELFFDRVDRGDAEWQDALDNPFGRVDYLLVERSDLITDRYPGIEDGDAPGFEVLTQNDRYTVVAVSAEDPSGEGQGSAAGEGSTAGAAAGTSGDGSSSGGTATEGVPGTTSSGGGGAGAGLGSAEPAPFDDQEGNGPGGGF
ncbi:MAG: ArnT family glycosyltransferase [Solirubrobacterales bacterium]